MRTHGGQVGVAGNLQVCQQLRRTQQAGQLSSWKRMSQEN